MIIKDLDLSSLSRQEYICFIGVILNSFIVDFSYFTESDIEFIQNMLIDRFESDTNVI